MKRAINLVRLEVRKYRRKLLLGGVMVFISAVLILPQPFLMGFMIDHIIPDKNVTGLLITVAFLIGINVLAALIVYCQQIIFFYVNSSITINIRKKLMEKLGRIPLIAAENFSTGYIMSRVQDDPPRVAALFGEQIINIMKQFFIFLVSLCAAFYINWKLSLVTIGLMPLFLYTVYYFGKKIKKQSEEVFEKVSLSSKSLQENIDMIGLSKIVCREKYGVKRYLRVILDAFRSFLKLKKIESTNNALLGFIGAFLPLAVLTLGGYEIIRGDFTVGALIAFMSVLSNIAGSATQFISFNIEIQKIVVALSRIDEMLAMPDEPAAPRMTDKNADSLCLKNVYFSYDGVKQVLADISIKAEKGMKIGIVGQSGSGKTTLIKILAGLYDFAGTIILDGVEIGQHNKKILRHKVSIIPQEPLLFNDSVYENVAIGKPGANKAEVKQALCMAHAWNFIEIMEDEEKTCVGERGNRLSVGQKQRIAIARALLRGADILILDEATSNIDNISEKEIMKAVNEISKDKIIFMIAHKLDNVKNCDKIIVLHEGRIVEEGTHDDLMRLNGYYSSLRNRTQYNTAI